LNRTKQIGIWLRQAEHDLKMAGKNYEIEGYDVCAFIKEKIALPKKNK
jgi:HEPN domain-containing protein